MHQVLKCSAYYKLPYPYTTKTVAFVKKSYCLRQRETKNSINLDGQTHKVIFTLKNTDTHEHAPAICML